MINNELYKQDICNVVDNVKSFDKLKNKTIVISGATGLIGTFLIDVIMKKNIEEDLNCRIYGISRTPEKAKDKFSVYCDKLLSFVKADINSKIDVLLNEKIDYIIHLASNTHPVSYANDPIGTITTNVIGLNNLLEFGKETKCDRFLFTSSNEVYGENRGDTELFDENYCGYIDCNTLRAGYPESKRCGEALCQAYISQYGMDIVIARLTRSFGPTLLKNDTKALSQFIQKGINGQNIVLKSEGNQYYSYTYVADAVNGLLSVLLDGSCGGAYNVATEECDITLKELASLVAKICDVNVIHELPNETEAKGFSKATKARLNGRKIKEELGWKNLYSLDEGLRRTISVLRTIKD